MVNITRESAWVILYLDFLIETWFLRVCLIYNSQQFVGRIDFWCFKTYQDWGPIYGRDIIFRDFKKRFKRRKSRHRKRSHSLQEVSSLNGRWRRLYREYLEKDGLRKLWMISKKNPVSPQDLNVAMRLLALGIDPNYSKDESIATHLSCALDPQMIKLLLFPLRDMAVKLDLVSNLHCACRGDHKEKVRLLLQAGANLNIEDEEGETLLIVASTWDHAEIIKLLLQAKANIHHIDRNNQSAINIAIDIIKILLSSGYSRANMSEREEDPLSQSIKTNQREIAKILLAAKISPNMSC